MRVHVEHGLPGVEAGVEHQTVRARELLVGDALGEPDDMGQFRGIGGGQLGDA